MARRKKRRSRKGRRNCRFGIVRRGRRKGQCLKQRRARKKRR